MQSIDDRFEPHGRLINRAINQSLIDWLIVWLIYWLIDLLLDKCEHRGVLPVNLLHPLRRVLWQRSVHRNTRNRSTRQMYHHVVDSLQILSQIVSIHSDTRTIWFRFRLTLLSDSTKNHFLMSERLHNTTRPLVSQTLTANIRFDGGVLKASCDCLKKKILALIMLSMEED